MVLLALLPDPIARAHLHAALTLESGIPHEVQFAADWSELHARASASAADLVAFDLYACGRLDLTACLAFHEAFPSLVLLPYSAVPLSAGPDLLRLAMLGVQNVIVRDEGDRPVALGLILSESLAQATAGRVLSALDDLIPEQLRPLVLYLLERAYQPVHPRELARLYCRHPKTLREHLRAAHLPTTQEMIGWARLFHAAHRLGDPGRSVESVALALEFPSAAALGNQLQRYAGMCPTRLAAAGGLNLLIERFRARCRELKTENSFV